LKEIFKKEIILKNNVLYEATILFAAAKGSYSKVNISVLNTNISLFTYGQDHNVVLAIK
jgi:hypothetical protein